MPAFTTENGRHIFFGQFCWHGSAGGRASDAQLYFSNHSNIRKGAFGFSKIMLAEQRVQKGAPCSLIGSVELRVPIKKCARNTPRAKELARWVAKNDQSLCGPVYCERKLPKRMYNFAIYLRIHLRKSFFDKTILFRYYTKLRVNHFASF